MHPLDSILDRWRQEEAAALFSRTHAMGIAFEDLCAAFLTHDPVQSLELQDVKTFAAWARERDLDQTDTGIDLVAGLRNESGFAAIQCKFLQTGTTVPNSEMASFLAASGRPEFRRRILIDTTARPWSKNAENTLRDQAIPVQRIGLHDLKASPIQWADYVTSDGEIVRTPPKTVRPHQQQAIDSALIHLESPGTRGKLLMACGTGKTLVGLRIAETLAGRGGRVLVLVPSLALLSQTLRAWVDDTELPVRAFAVCSDSQTGRPRRSADDTADMDVLDLAYPATTDPARLAKAAEPDAPDRMTVVFATYQSSGVLEEAQQRHGLPAFDLAIADEAHRTAGALIPGEDPSPFVRIHDNGAIRAGRRLYMTATAKVYAESARTRAGKLATTLCSMDDEDRYGPVLHETRFGDAVEQGLLADYRVIVLTVPEALAAQVTIRNFAEGETLTIDEQGRMIGCLRALAKTDTDQFPEDDRAPMRRAIAFCNFIKSSQQLEQRIHDVAEGYADYTGDTDAPPVSARHVDGTFNAAGRADALAFLDETPGDETRILTNARCLTEGVDVPALDGILFMHPRKSQIEVVQAVGRVMRQAPGKKLGYIILPVVVPSTGTPEQALDDDTRWRTVWQMLNAIRSHDERFEGMLNRLGMGDSGDRVSIIALADWRPASEPSGDNRPAADPHAGDTSTPAAQQQAMVFEGLPEAIRTKIVEKCGNRRYWEEWAGDVARIARAHIERIRAIIDSGEAERAIFHEFLDELRDDLNPDVMENEAIEMLAQHMVTKPVFDALFGDAAAAHRNAVSQGMQTVLDVLEPAGLDREAEAVEAARAEEQEKAGRALTAAKNKTATLTDEKQQAETRAGELEALNKTQTKYVTDWHGDRGVELPDLATVEGQSAAWTNMRAWEAKALKKAEDEAAAKEAAEQTLENERDSTQAKIDAAVRQALEDERERQEAEREEEDHGKRRDGRAGAGTGADARGEHRQSVDGGERPDDGVAAPGRSTAGHAGGAPGANGTGSAGRAQDGADVSGGDYVTPAGAGEGGGRPARPPVAGDQGQGARDQPGGDAGHKRVGGGGNLHAGGEEAASPLGGEQPLDQGADVARSRDAADADALAGLDDLLRHQTDQWKKHDRDRAARSAAARSTAPDRTAQVKPKDGKRVEAAAKKVARKKTQTTTRDQGR